MYYNRLRNHIEKLRAVRFEKQQALDLCVSKIEATISELETIKRAKILVQGVAEETQKKVQYHVSNLVSNALLTVFENPYTFQLNFIKKRGRTEAELKFEKDGNLYEPIDDSGGGVLDIASFALRLALWGLEGSSQTIILDEPSKHLSADRQQRYSELLIAIQRRLNIQFVIVTHMEVLKNAADTIITVADGKVESTINIERGDYE